MKQAVKKAAALLLMASLAVGTLYQGTAAEAKVTHKFIQDKPKPEKGGIGGISASECFLVVETPSGDREISTGMDGFSPIWLNQTKSAYAWINLPDYSKAVSSSLKSSNKKVLKVVNKKQGKIKALKLGTAKLTAEVKWKYTGKPCTISYPVLKKLSKSKAKKYGGTTHLVKEKKLKVKKGKTYTFKLTVAVKVICKKHAYGAWKTTKKATCSAEGEKQRKCKKCGVFDAKGIDKLPHTYGEWKVTKPATQENRGEKTRVCTVCGEEDFDDIDKLPEGSQPSAGNPSSTPNGGSASNPPAPTDAGGISAPTKEAGLYDTDGKLVKSWGELIKEDRVSVNNNGRLNSCSNNISGNLVIGNGVTSIDEDAFSECGNLTSVTIPGSVTSIGHRAFTECRSLTSVTIPDSVTSIGVVAFLNCSSLTSVTIPDSVTSIGYQTFSGCSSLSSVTIPDSVTSIGDRAFSGCSSLSSVTIPDSVTSIGEDAFECCNFTSITIPESVTSIGDGAFGGCRSLSSVAIPESVTSIGGYAFSDCDSLTSVTIPESVTSIGEGAFYWCDSLTSVTIPESVTSIGEDAFSEVPLVIYDGNAGNYSEWRAKKVQKSDGTVLYSK